MKDLSKGFCSRTSGSSSARHKSGSGKKKGSTKIQHPEFEKIIKSVIGGS